MKVQQLNLKAIKLTLTENKQEIGRVFVYFIKNDLHPKSYALIEDLFVNEEQRGEGYGKRLILAAIEEAKKANCYKIIATSRHERELVHKLYLKFGFRDYGKEFRLNLE